MIRIDNEKTARKYENVNSEGAGDVNGELMLMEIAIVEEDEDVYVGNILNGQRFGSGLCRFANGSIYEGQWQDNKPHGIGTFIYSGNTGIAIGEWNNGKLEGKGTYKWGDGRIYEGEWSDSKINGTGFYLFANGDTYEGDFVDNKFHGNGRYSWKRSGNIYEGAWKQGKRHGRGKEIEVQDNTVYEGFFIENKRHGKGFYKYDDGITHTIEFEYGKEKEGSSTFKDPNGTIRENEGGMHYLRHSTTTRFNDDASANEEKVGTLNSPRV
jgi:hypothetical protein